MRKARAVQTELDGMQQQGPLRPVTPLARATSIRGHKARKRAAPAPKPWECVICNVDTAKVSGWAITVRGKVIEYGQHDTECFPGATERVIGMAVGLGSMHDLPVVLVLEAPYGGAVYMLVALGVAKERWLKAWRDAAMPKSRVVTVEPSVWRGPVLGSWAVGKPREQVRASEMSMALGITGAKAMGADAAAAVCISHWSAHAPAVGAKIGKRGQRASMRAWTGTT